MSDKQKVTGTVIETLGDSRFRIELEEGREIIGYLSGKMKLHHIMLMIGNKVIVEVDEYGGKATNRIIMRK